MYGEQVVQESIREVDRGICRQRAGKMPIEAHPPN